jgi:hypothetical protein
MILSSAIIGLLSTGNAGVSAFQVIAVVPLDRLDARWCSRDSQNEAKGEQETCRVIAQSTSLTHVDKAQLLMDIELRRAVRTLAHGDMPK